MRAAVVRAPITIAAVATTPALRSMGARKAQGRGSVQERTPQRVPQRAAVGVIFR